MHVIANGRKTKAPHLLLSIGKNCPTKKLQVQDERLPKAMATGRGPTSKSSERFFFVGYFKRAEEKRREKCYLPAAMKNGIGPSPS